jgi:hypothetical protein
MQERGFLNRAQELKLLHGLRRSEAAQLFVLYGRRRVGKTELLRAFCGKHPHVYFQAAQVSDRDNLRQFLQEAAEATHDPFLARANFQDWEAPLEYLASRTPGKRLIVVLDEFPYLCEANKALPSILQRFWDAHGKDSRLMLVLCGSSVSFMQDEVLAERSPLYGRRTGQLELQPFSYRDSAAFLPEHSLDDNLRAYGMLGGIPMYLGQFDGAASIAANVQQALLQPGALLYDEPEYLLRMELRDPRTYNSILQAIASGLTKRSEIADRVGMASTQMSPYLATLEKLRITERVAPVADRAPERVPRGRYFVRDNFLRFWYRFVLPNRSLLEIGERERVWRERVEPHLDEHLSFVFEDVCREYVQRHAREKLPVLPAGGVGRHWHKDAEIELVCRNTDGSTYCGACKWSRQPVDLRELTGLEEKAKTLPQSWQEGLRYVLFSRSGFRPELKGREDGKRVILVDLEDLYGVKPARKPRRR